MDKVQELMSKNLLPVIYTACSAIKPDDDGYFAYFLVLDYTHLSNDGEAMGIIFKSDGKMQCIGHFDVNRFADEWTWDKTEDKVHGTFLNEDYIYMHDSIYELKLIKHDKPIKVN